MKRLAVVLTFTGTVVSCGDDTTSTDSRIEEVCEDWCEIGPRCYDEERPEDYDCVQDTCIPQYFRFEACADLAVEHLECHVALTCEEYDTMFGPDGSPGDMQPCPEESHAFAVCNGEHAG